MKVTLIVVITAGVILAEIFAVKGLVAFQRHALAKYGHKFFRVGHFLAIIFAGLLVGLGLFVHTTSLDNAGPVSNGIVLMVVGAGVLGGLFLRNSLKTSLVYGGIGTTLEVVISPFLFNIGLFALVALLLGGAQYLGATPARVVNQR